MNSEMQYVVHVNTSDGHTTVHTYETPEDEDFAEFTKPIYENIYRSMNGDAPYLLLANPLVYYNMSHVVRIGTTPVAPEVEQSKLRQEMARNRAGFRTQT